MIYVKYGIVLSRKISIPTMIRGYYIENLGFVVTEVRGRQHGCEVELWRIIEVLKRAFEKRFESIGKEILLGYEPAELWYIDEAEGIEIELKEWKVTNYSVVEMIFVVRRC